MPPSALRRPRRSARPILAGTLGATLLLAACSAAQTPQASPSTSPSAAPSSVPPASSPSPSAAPTDAPSPTATAEPTPTPEPTGGVYAGTVAGVLDPRVANLPHRVYVPNELSNDIAVIDPETFEIVGRFAVGAAPEHVSPDWDLSTLYVNNMNNATMTVIDPVTEEPIDTMEVPFPYNLFFTPDGEKAIVVADYLGYDMVADNGLHFYDRETWEHLKFVQVPYPGVNHLDFSADGSYLMVSTETAGHVVKVDVETMEIVGSVDVGGSPLDVRLAPEGDIFYVANQLTHGVDLVNGDTLEHVGFIPTALGAHAFGFSRDVSRLFVTNRMAGTLTVIDTKTRQVIDEWNIGGSPDMVTLSPDGSQMWISNRFHGTVVVIDPDTGSTLATIETGGNPHGLTYWPQPGTISLGHNGNTR
ncbi:MAG TPA: cytochrome D1 domain-containing protein [Candidatus Angelobacter sp.]|nr:cytochrome D1 domain-containing protein [Candidatus Angelobacter sp.]